MTAFEDSLPSPPSDPDTPFSYPLAHPDPASKPVAPMEPSPDQLVKLDRLVDYFNKPDFRLPTTLRALKARWAKEQGGGGSRFGSLFSRSATPINDGIEDLHPLSDVEKCYWSRQAFSRCLRAVKWDYAAGVRRAEETCVWRREYGVEEMKEEDVSHEGETGKELVMGYDINCRPVLYMHPNRQNTETSPKQIAFVVWCLERTIDLAPATDPATEMLCLCIDFGANQKDAKSQPTTLSQARKVLEILQTYYCERLGRAVCVNIPQIFFAFYKLVSPFVDPVTKEKIRFLDKADATSLIPASQLQKIFGGDINMEYDHKTYFPALTKLCMERKAANLERWRKFGENRCGLDEAIIRGARVPGQEANGKQEVATEETDVDAAPASAPAENGTHDARGVTPLSEEFAAAALDDPATPAMTTGSDSSERTAVSPSAGDASPGPDKFVEAPLASPSAVARAQEAVHI
ncbi:Phosphatidylinositol transfer protein (PITP) [Rhodotorula toruloides]